MLAWLCRLLGCCPPAAQRVRWRISGSTPNTYFEGESMSGRITTEQRVSVTVNPLTAGGNIAPIDGVVAFSSSDLSVAFVEALGDHSALVTAVGLGVAQITAEFDADLGEGVRTIVATGAIEVVAAEAVSAEIVFGTPEVIPPAE